MQEKTYLDIFYAIPSSVPSTTPQLETTGGLIEVKEVVSLLKHPKVIALGEAMNFKGITDEPNSLIRQILKKVQDTKPFMPLEGHIPNVSGETLAKFMFAGLTADHTQQTPESILEKVTNGIFLELQKKSITPENIKTIVDYGLYEHVALITDDIMADDLLEGHLDTNVRLAIECGMPVEEAIYMTTYTPTRRMGFQYRGAIASGFLADLAILNKKVIAAHGIFFNDEDIKILKEADVAVSHCIGANTKSAKGVAPVQKMIQAGLRVGLGTDGPSSGNTLDLFTQMKLFANFHKTLLQDRSAFPARDIVRMATIGGAEVLGLASKIGSLKKGKKADLILVETNSANMFPIFDPYSVLVYSANASNVQDVMINGKWIVRDKLLVQQDLSTLRHNLSKQMTHFRKIAIEMDKKE
ncbi:amidohydrolase family protein [Carnobacterium sp. TMP28]|uniref:amidohydrolase family protein n=1 Tax=Carnobacterium sp. TMP28 TaxID=3397060 RepID=UPI0039DFC542